MSWFNRWIENRICKALEKYGTICPNLKINIVYPLETKDRPQIHIKGCTIVGSIEVQEIPEEK